MKNKMKYQKGGKKVSGKTNRKGNTEGVLGDTDAIGSSHYGMHNAGVAQKSLNKFNQNTLVGKALKKASPEEIAQRKADKAAAKKAGMSVFNYKKSKKVKNKKLGGFRDESFLEDPTPTLFED
jgi:restriction endonuclease Mrr